MIVLAAGDYRLEIDPARGGSILRFDWRGEPLMRPVCGPSMFDVACFPLVPFSNRIAWGRFSAHGREVRIEPNFPGSDHPHPLHGFGWLAAWDVLEATDTYCLLEHRYPAGEWPWPYAARQTFRLGADGLSMGLELENRGTTSMPAGLGFHPYFPRDKDTLYEGFHLGEWRNRADCLPYLLDARPSPIDWWNGQPVGSRSVDTVYARRQGPLRISWPSRGRFLQIIPSAELDHTAVFTPEQADHFCIEPVSHATDALNSADPAEAITWLVPGAVFAVGMRLEASTADGVNHAIDQAP